MILRILEILEILDAAIPNPMRAPRDGDAAIPNPMRALEIPNIFKILDAATRFQTQWVSLEILDAAWLWPVLCPESHPSTGTLVGVCWKF